MVGSLCSLRPVRDTPRSSSSGLYSAAQYPIVWSSGGGTAGENGAHALRMCSIFSKASFWKLQSFSWCKSLSLQQNQGKVYSLVLCVSCRSLSLGGSRSDLVSWSRPYLD